MVGLVGAIDDVMSAPCQARREGRRSSLEHENLSHESPLQPCAGQAGIDSRGYARLIAEWLPSDWRQKESPGGEAGALELI
jgi:hypothetical protein